MGIFDDLVKELSPIDYREYSKKLVSAGRRAKEWGYIFRNLASLCDVMELKYDLGVRTRQAYAAGDLEVLEGLIGDYRKTEARLKKFIASFRAQWLRENKPFGLEIQEARLGGLLLRISSCRQRISEYVEGTIDCIEELETPILPYGSDGHLYENEYQKLISTSNL
jgi:hypothetical protein